MYAGMGDESPPPHLQQQQQQLARDLHLLESGGCGNTDPVERTRAVRERREAEQRRRLDELRAHAAAAQAQRDQREAERRRRAHEQRNKEDERRQQVEERKKAIWEAGMSRREALLRRDREREERVERQRAARSCGARTNVFAFGSSTPRMLEPADTGGIFWGHRSTNPLDQMNFFESLLASSTSNVMFTSAPLTRRSSTYDLDRSNNDRDKQDESGEQYGGGTPVAMWSSVARRRTDLVPTIPAPRAPEGGRSGDTTPGSRPGSAMSSSITLGAYTPARARPAPRRPRPASIAGTGLNTPRGVECASVETTPSVSRDATSTNMSGGAGDGVVRRPHTARRPRPASMHATPSTPAAAGDGKPPLHRRPKPAREHDKTPSRGMKSPMEGAPWTSKEPGVDKDTPTSTPAPAGRRNTSAPHIRAKSQEKQPSSVPAPAPAPSKSAELVKDSKQQVSATEVTQKLEALQLQESTTPSVNLETPAPAEQVAGVQETLAAAVIQQTPPLVLEPPVQPEEKKESAGLERTEEGDMTSTMLSRSVRITTEEQAKAALAERRRKAREELERQAEFERQRLEREAAEEAERQREEEERQRQLEEEARELAELQRRSEEEKLRKAIEAAQQAEQEARERAVREEEERVARAREEEEDRRAKELAEVQRREEAEREEAERSARRRRVEAIMLRTRQKKAEEEKTQQENGAKEDPTNDNNTSVQDQQQPNDNANIIQSTFGFIQAERNHNNTQQQQQQQQHQQLLDNVELLPNSQKFNQNSNVIDLLSNSQNSNIDLLTNTLNSNLDLLSNSQRSNIDLLTQHIDVEVTKMVDSENIQSSVELLSSQPPAAAAPAGPPGPVVAAAPVAPAAPHNGHTTHNGHTPTQYPLTLHNAV